MLDGGVLITYYYYYYYSFGTRDGSLLSLPFHLTRLYYMHIVYLSFIPWVPLTL